jgi:hypothetical protein
METDNTLELEKKIKSLQGEINSKLLTISWQQKQLEQYYNKLKLGDDLNNKEKIIVSDHAILRTVERLFHVDLEKIKEIILPNEVVKRINFIGKGKGTVIHGGIVYVIKEYTVVTVYPENKEEKVI